jgi:hypothetical protein
VPFGSKIVSNQAIYLITTWAIPAIVAITFHEAAHGFAAHQLGDDTAWRLGRVTLNPLRHIDPFGTILLPGMLLLLGAPVLFGYAKPVPVNFRGATAAASRHGVGSGRRAGHQYCARGCRKPGLLHRRLPTRHRCAVAGGQLAQRIGLERDAGGFQLVSAAAIGRRTRPGRTSAEARCEGRCTA